MELSFGYYVYDPETFGFSSGHLFVSLRSAAQWMFTDAICALYRNDRQAARQDVHALVQLCEFNKEDPLLSSQMFRVAITGPSLALTWEALQSPDWNEEELAFFQKDWEQVDMFQAALTGFLGGRALMEMEFGMIRSNGFRNTLRRMIPGNNGSQTWETIKDIPASSIWRLSAEKNELFAFKQYQGALECVRNLDHLPWPEIHAREVALQIESGNTFDGGKIGFGLKHYQYAMSALIIPNTAGYTQVINRHEAFRRLTITAIALKRFQLRRRHLPAELNELVPEFISAVPIDPMNIQPLHYRLNADGTFVLYSVGEDGKDDGGDPTPTNSKSPPDLWNARDAVWPAAEESSNIQAPSTRE
ncbi:MAG: hypothetical protein HOP33_20055 [Verrucomicrobia bacterium]|nr:hypothetical protein [Verrucomicrobiota bacterium]